VSWKHLKNLEWLERRALFLSKTPKGDRHLEAGCSTCLPLRHFMELRPDIQFSALGYYDFSNHVPAGGWIFTGWI
jgi:hypothetical protein